MEFLTSSSTPSVLCLTSAAGSGKSTVAVTASDRRNMKGRSAAYIFFEREKSEPSSVFCTIPYQLAMLHPSFASHPSMACRNNKDITENAEEALLLGLLSAIEDEGSDRIVLILDALDECGSVDEREDLLNLLKNEFARLPPSGRERTAYLACIVSALATQSLTHVIIPFLFKKKALEVT